MNDRVLVAKMIAWMEEDLLEPVSADELAARSGYSLNRFRQKFFNVTGDTPSGYVRKRRLTEASRSYFGVTPVELSKIEGKYRRFIRRMREAYTIMELAELKQPPIATTLMGSTKGVADYFDLNLDLPMLFGLSGHSHGGALLGLARDRRASGEGGRPRARGVEAARPHRRGGRGGSAGGLRDRGAHRDDVADDQLPRLGASCSLIPPRRLRLPKAGPPGILRHE